MAASVFQRGQRSGHDLCRRNLSLVKPRGEIRSAGFTLRPSDHEAATAAATSPLLHRANTNAYTPDFASLHLSYADYACLRRLSVATSSKKKPIPNKPKTTDGKRTATCDCKLISTPVSIQSEITIVATANIEPTIFDLFSRRLVHSAKTNSPNMTAGMITTTAYTDASGAWNFVLANITRYVTPAVAAKAVNARPKATPIRSAILRTITLTPCLPNLNI